MANILKLRGKLVENGLTIEQLSKIVGIHKATLYRKFNGNGDNITIKEACIIANALHLTADEVNLIFFSQIVA